MRPFADLSGWNRPAAEIDWSQYVAWSAHGDGLARLLLKSSEGVGAKDKNFEGYWSRAVLEGVHILAPYHYARPDLQPGTSGAQQEARYFASVIGSRLRANDRLMLDLEQNESGAWAKAFGLELRQLLPRAPKPVLYDSLAHIQQFLQDAELPDIFDLAIAAWHDPAQ